MVGKIAV